MKKPERAGASPVEEVGTSPIRSGYLPILAPYPRDWNANLQKIFHQNKASESFCANSQMKDPAVINFSLFAQTFKIADESIPVISDAIEAFL